MAFRGSRHNFPKNQAVSIGWRRLKDRSRISICALISDRPLSGEEQPFVTIFGKHPDKVWQHTLETRKAKQGEEFSDWFDQTGNLKPDIPGKTAHPANPHPGVEVPIRPAAVLRFPEKEAYWNVTFKHHFPLYQVGS